MVMEKFEVKFIDGVYGFIYDSCCGRVCRVFTEPLTEKEVLLIESVIVEDDCLFTDINSVNELFDFNDNSLECDTEGLNKVVEYVK
jgi:hypothetical protein